MSIQKMVTEHFLAQFGESPAFVVRAPGRVNIIGEHTDYNDGFVLPMAIDRALWIALRARTDRRVVVHSLDFDETVSLGLDECLPGEESWVEYVKGMAWVLQDAGYGLRGWEGVMAGDVPIGAGLSSSAALELATARAFATLSEWAWAPAEMAKLGQRTENEWVGVNCGIMDQMISATGEAGHALLIDCRSLSTESVPLPPRTAVLVLDTATRRGLVDSAYNERRSQCEAAARFFGVPALRDVSVTQFELTVSPELDELTRRRARHVITENERTLQAAEAMRQGNALTLGRLMDESHRSLRDDFEVSSDALNTMVEIARQTLGCLGARMTGGGFGGCAVALVDEAAAYHFSKQVATDYQQKTGLTPNIYLCKATNGAEIV
ncbi:MAG: galactokinase [Ardenticatenaceae bacterium]